MAGMQYVGLYPTFQSVELFVLQPICEHKRIMSWNS